MALQIRHETLQVFGDGDRFTILQISDVHIWFSNAIPDELERIIREQKPDLVALTGDYSDTPAGTRIFRRFMEKIGNDFPVVFIGGNHDTWWGKKVFRIIEDVSNCIYVEHRFHQMKTRGGHPVNIGSKRHGPLYDRHKQDTNIMLIHNPEELRDSDMDHVNLVLAGHLHGGQIVLYKKDRTYYPGGLVFRHCSDRKQVNDTTLIVTRGAGDTFPIRINCPKEVVMVTIE